MQAAPTETLRPLNVPLPSAGASLPQVFANDHALVVLYRVDGPELGFDGSNPRSVGVDSENEHMAVIKAGLYQGLQFGAPNDEALSGHRLYPIGLKHYAAFEVLNSSWLSQLETMNRVHPRDRSELFSGLRHFIFTFHDSTLEIAARDISVGLVRGSMRAVLVKAVQVDESGFEEDSVPSQAKPHMSAARGGFLDRFFGRR